MQVKDTKLTLHDVILSGFFIVEILSNIFGGAFLRKWLTGNIANHFSTKKPSLQIFDKVLIKSLRGELFTIIYRLMCQCSRAGGDGIGCLSEIPSFLVLVSVIKVFLLSCTYLSCIKYDQIVWVIFQLSTVSRSCENLQFVSMHHKIYNVRNENFAKMQYILFSLFCLDERFSLNLNI